MRHAIIKRLATHSLKKITEVEIRVKRMRIKLFQYFHLNDKIGTLSLLLRVLEAVHIKTSKAISLQIKDFVHSSLLFV